MWPLNSSTKHSAVVIHIGSSSVGGAYVQYETGKPGVILFTIRVEIELRSGENVQTAMLRALDAVGNELIEKGAPVLRRETGSGHVEDVLVSVSAPWQDTNVRTERISPGKPFVFSKEILSEAVSSHEDVAENRVNVGNSVIATILNGYDIQNPIGKKVQRAEVVVLSSTLEKSVVEEIRKRVRAIYHTHTIAFTTFAPVAYSVLRDLYLHERDFLILDVSGEGTDLAFIKGGLLVDVGAIQQGTHTINSKSPNEAHDSWLKNLIELFKEFAEVHALPRTLFLLTEPHAREHIKHSLAAPLIHELWLSDEPLSIISVTPEQFSVKVRTRAEGQGDVFLSILALHQQKLLKS